MIKLFILSVIVCASYSLHGRETPWQSTQEIDSLLDLSYQATIDVDVESSLQTALEALSRSEQIDYSAGISKASFFIGQALYNYGNYEKSLEYLSLSEKEKFTQSHPQQLSEISRIRGRIFSILGLNRAAINEFKKGLTNINRIEKRKNREYLTSLAYENLGVVYKALEMPDSMLYYIEKDKQLLLTMDESFVFRNWINLYSALGEYYSEQAKYDSAAYSFRRSLELCEKYNFPYTSNTYFYWGNNEMKQGNMDSALHYYFKALENVNQTQLKNELPPLYEKIAAAFSVKGIADSVKYYHDKAMAVENELAREKSNASQPVLDIILKDETEKKSQRTRRIILLLTGSFLILFVIGGISYRVVLSKKKGMIKHAQEQTIELKQKLNESLEKVILLAQKNDPAFLASFQEAYPDFCKRLTEKHSDLINSELSFCAMIFLNFTSKEIAQYTFIEHRSVQTKKSRLRKKLNLASDVDLYQYLYSLS